MHGVRRARDSALQPILVLGRRTATTGLVAHTGAQGAWMQRMSTMVRECGILERENSVELLLFLMALEIGGQNRDRKGAVDW